MTGLTLLATTELLDPLLLIQMLRVKGDTNAHANIALNGCLAILV